MPRVIIRNRLDPDNPIQGGVALVQETSFTTTQGWTADLTHPPDSFSGLQTGVSNWGGWTTSNGTADQVVSAANRVAGAGGRGFRHWRGDGQNNNGGGMSIAIPSPATEVWVRFYMRVQAGAAWSGGTPQYTKEHYWNAGASIGEVVFGVQGTGWGCRVYADARPQISSSITWADTMGGGTGDGLWHCYEYHMKRDTSGANGVLEIWVDDVQGLSISDVDYGGTSLPWGDFILGDNADAPSNGGVDFATDYDDLAISVVGRVGL